MTMARICRSVTISSSLWMRWMNGRQRHTYGRAGGTTPTPTTRAGVVAAAGRWTQQRVGGVAWHKTAGRRRRGTRRCPPWFTVPPVMVGGTQRKAVGRAPWHVHPHRAGGPYHQHAPRPAAPGPSPRHRSSLPCRRTASGCPQPAQLPSEQAGTPWLRRCPAAKGRGGGCGMVLLGVGGDAAGSGTWLAGPARRGWRQSTRA